jgi:hypothetical protein
VVASVLGSAQSAGLHSGVGTGGVVGDGGGTGGSPGKGGVLVLGGGTVPDVVGVGVVVGMGPPSGTSMSTRPPQASDTSGKAKAIVTGSTERREWRMPSPEQGARHV